MAGLIGVNRQVNNQAPQLPTESSPVVLPPPNNVIEQTKQTSLPPDNVDRLAQARVDQFRKLVASSVKNGIKIKLADQYIPDLTQKQTDATNHGSLTATNNSPERALKHLLSPSALEQHKQNGNKTLELAPYRMLVDKNNALRVYDYFAPGAPKIFEATGPKARDEAISFLNQYHCKMKDTHQNVLDSVIASKEEPMVSFSKERLVSADEQKNLHRLLKTHNIAVAFTPPGASDELSPLLISLNEKDFSNSNDSSLIVNGSITGIIVTPKSSQTKEDSPRPNQNKFLQKTRFSPYKQPEKDAFGNLVKRTKTGDKSSDELCICPLPEQRNEGPSITNHSQKKGVSFGGGDSKLPVFENLILDNREQTLDKVGSYKIVTNGLKEDLSANQKEQLKHLAEGISRCEANFGLAAGSVITKINVLEGFSENAFFRKNDPHTIYIRSEDLKKDSPKLLSGAGYHETAHAIENQMKAWGSSNNFANEYQLLKGEHNYARYLANKSDTHTSKTPTLSKAILPPRPRATPDNKVNSFLAEISEENFFSNKNMGGHAYDSSGELFASFCLSLTKPDWAATVKDKPGLFKIDYKNALEKLELDLKSTKQIPPTAPIYRAIDSRLSYLKLAVGDNQGSANQNPNSQPKDPASFD